MDMAAGPASGRQPGICRGRCRANCRLRIGPGPRGGWRQRMTLVADDICQGLSADALGFTHMRQTESLADNLPTELERDRSSCTSMASECLYDRKPSAAAALRGSIDEGTLVVNYTGHGSEGQLADERVLETGKRLEYEQP